jgi:hypothetical protein
MGPRARLGAVTGTNHCPCGTYSELHGLTPQLVTGDIILPTPLGVVTLTAATMMGSVVAAVGGPDESRHTPRIHAYTHTRIHTCIHA